MTYGEFLRYCRGKAGIESKSDFARKIGMIAVDHYIGAENDRDGKKPSIDLMERAAKIAGLEFQDFINTPEKEQTPRSRAHQALHRQLQALLDREDEASDWIAANISVYYKAYFRRR